MTAPAPSSSPSRPASQTGPDAAPPAVSLWQVLAFWFKLGFISFGGPAGQIALMHRTRGGIVAGGLFVLPSLLILIGLSWVYIAFGLVPLVAGLFYGIKPARHRSRTWAGSSPRRRC